MSRDWREHKYTSTENLWCWIDQQSLDIDTRLMRLPKSSESYQLFNEGRREMLDALVDYLKENETELGEIADRWGLKEEA